jgi:hypothetical protein
MADERDLRIVELEADNAALRQEVSALKGTNDVMARRIAELEKKSGRNSQNSSMPPSSDTFGNPAKEESPNRKARRAMGMKPGKQPGTSGAHLAQVKDPDKIVPHAPEPCIFEYSSNSLPVPSLSISVLPPEGD